jgi:hypothetical protein
MRTHNRPWHTVPRSLWLMLGGMLALQLLWHDVQAPPRATARDLPSPPRLAVARIAALGDAPVAARVGTLWLQAFDTQAGISLPLGRLPYDRLVAWLELLLTLEPSAQYPLLLASRWYAEVPDPVRSRQMLDFVSREFAGDPSRRWPWLAQAVYVARHRLHDLPLALEYARALAASPAAGIPDWARQLEIFVLEDMGELEAAKVLLGGLLASGEIRDPHERRWLSQRLDELAVRSGARAPR